MEEENKMLLRLFRLMAIALMHRRTSLENMQNFRRWRLLENILMKDIPVRI